MYTNPSTVFASSTNIPDSISRTVLPTAINSSTNDLTWTLTGTKTENSNVIEKTWYDDEALGTAYSQMINDNSILLEEGTWTFTLFATRNNKKVLEETADRYAKTLVDAIDAVSLTV